MRRSLLVCALLAGCGGDPVNVGGNYSVSLTNGTNGCAFANWTEGMTAQNVPFTITQNSADITGQVGGIAGGFLTLVLGSATFMGKATGPALDLTLYGKTQASKQGTSCSYTVNAHATATLAGDFLSGAIDYVTATNGSPDCGTLSTCKSTQQFNGTRPPAPK